MRETRSISDIFGLDIGVDQAAMHHISVPQFKYLGYGASGVIDLPSCNLSTAKGMASMRCTGSEMK
jgi:hypothetical protein